jgi:hypothetical protein
VRTIVFSDAHGEPDVIRSVVQHAHFDPATDRLIFAGDAIEVGRDSLGALVLIDELGAEFVVGNHEYAVFLGDPLEFEPVSARVEGWVRERREVGEWPLVAEADGVLISHAGLSQRFAEQFDATTVEGSVAEFAEDLSREFRAALASRDLVLGGVCGRDGPLWYRPRVGVPPLAGVTQIAGHTPVALLHSEAEAERLAETGMYLIDPHVRRWRALGYPPPTPLRYAVIAQGSVSICGV